MSEPLWSDERIEREYAANSDEYHTDIQLLYRMRDEMQARIAELEAQLAQTWQPVQEHSHTEYLNMGQGKASVWQRVEIRGRLITIDRTDKGMSAALLPNGMGVFRKAQEAQP